MYSSSINVIISPFQSGRLFQKKPANRLHRLDPNPAQQVTERRGILFRRLLPNLRTPDLESGVIPDEHHFAPQIQQFALLVWKHDSSLLITGDMLRAGRKWADKSAPLTGSKTLVMLYFFRKALKLPRGHYHQKS